MKKLVLFFSLISLSLVTLTASAAEQCPTTGALQSIFAQSNSLPSDGKMPYPVNMDDPVYQPDDQTWFVVTHIETSDRGDPAKYIAFAVFKDPNPASPMSNAAAIVEAKSMVDASATKVSSAVDYKNFFMGTQGGRDYYFDVCMYTGSMDKPPVLGAKEAKGVASSPR